MNGALTQNDVISQYSVDYGELEIICERDSGGQAVVYEASLHRQKVAVKRFHSHVRRDLDLSLIAKLSHRNVIRLL